jgi:hypothetical protein
MFLYLLITGLIFLLVGVRAILRPVETVAIPNSLGADNVDAKNYLRAGAGGVTIACAAVLIGGAFVQFLEFAALVLSVTIMGGLVFGRFVSWRLDGRPGMFPMISGGGEAIGFVLGVFWLWRFGG